MVAWPGAGAKGRDMPARCEPTWLLELALALALLMASEMEFMACLQCIDFEVNDNAVTD